MQGSFVFDPSRPILRVDEPRLNRILLRDPARCASVSEYAAATGISTDDVLNLFGDALDAGWVSLEIWGNEMFVHTAPDGRPARPDAPQLAPNLWEVLRDHASVEHAYALWKLVRGMQDAGWKVETVQARILFGLGPLRSRPYLGIHVGATVVPVLVLPSADAIATGDGLLAEYERAGAAAVAVVCHAGALDTMVTAVRRWVLSHHWRPSLHTLLLEAPRFNPTLLSPDDASVLPKAVSQASLAEGWTANPAAEPSASYPSGDDGTGYGRW